MLLAKSETPSGQEKKNLIATPRRAMRPPGALRRPPSVPGELDVRDAPRTHLHPGKLIRRRSEEGDTVEGRPPFEKQIGEFPKPRTAGCRWWRPRHHRVDRAVLRDVQVRRGRYEDVIDVWVARRPTRRLPLREQVADLVLELLGIEEVVVLDDEDDDAVCIRDRKRLTHGADLPIRARARVLHGGHDRLVDGGVDLVLVGARREYALEVPVAVEDRDRVARAYEAGPEHLLNRFDPIVLETLDLD